MGLVFSISRRLNRRGTALSRGWGLNSRERLIGLSGLVRTCKTTA